MSGTILCINSGSSSLKFALYSGDRPDALADRVHGRIENIGLAPHLQVRAPDGTTLAEHRWAEGDPVTHETLLATLLDKVDEHVGADLLAVGHRVVHGGARFVDPVRIDAGVLAALDALCPLAPLHQPHNLAAVRAVMRLRPQLPQVACFDTAFHHTQPAVAMRLALPRAITDAGVRRYGFHGISYDYIARRLRQIDPALAAGRLIVGHLGNGASLCAMQGGRSVDTTMGFSTLDGLVMGTRCGTLDPGAVLYLFQQKGLSVQAVQHMLYSESGLLGVSGLSSDMRTLEQSDDPRAREAIELSAYRIAREAGALVASLGGLDGLVFTAGIGENSATVRQRVCQRLAWLGIALDDAANARHDAVISRPDSRVKVRVERTDEERLIGTRVAELLRSTAHHDTT